MQINEIEFITKKDNTIFTFPISQATYTHQGVLTENTGTPLSLFDGIYNEGNTNKFCKKIDLSAPYQFIINFNTEFIIPSIREIKIYNSNDTAAIVSRIPVTFSLDRSLDGNSWINIFSVENGTPISTANYATCYDLTNHFLQ